jgi:hypothetical protein
VLRPYRVGVPRRGGLYLVRQFGNTPGRCVLVREANSTKAYDLALFTFDAEASPAKVVARYAVRWSIEPSNATGKHRPPAAGLAGWPGIGASHGLGRFAHGGPASTLA